MSLVTIRAFPKGNQEHVRVSLEHVRGHHVADLRVCVPLAAHSPNLIPTKAGLSIGVEHLGELISALQAAQAKACELGMLQGAA